MGLRFSMKWLLAGMAYVAVAAVTLSRHYWVGTDVLWLAALAALGYALLTVCFARGPRQASAAGFVTFAAFVLAAVVFAPEALPTRRLIQSVSPAPEPTVIQQTVATAPALPTAPQPYYQPPAQAPPATPVYAAAPQVVVSLAYSDQHLPLKTRAVHAIATMTAGLMGCVLGALAYRRSRPAAAAPPSTA